jgi:hypothetical protein
MPYPNGFAPFIDDGIYAEDYGDDGDDNYEPDLQEKTNTKPTRKSTKGRKLKRWDGQYSPTDVAVLIISRHGC